MVDNGSSDGAALMVAREFPQVRLIRNRANAGFSRANNQAALIARGRYLFFLNNDTVVPPHTLGKLVDFLECHPEAVLVGPRLRDSEGRVQMSYRQRPTIATFLHRTLLLRWTGLLRGRYRAYRRDVGEVVDQTGASGKLKTYPTVVDVLMGAAMLMRRTEFLELGGWDEEFTFGGEDMELCHRARQRGDVLYLPDVEIVHRGRASTRQHIGYASTQIAVGFVKYFRKTGASRTALFFYKLAVTLDAPVQLLVKGGQYLIRRLRGNKLQAEKSLTVVRGVGAFLVKGLWSFWAA